MDGLVKSSRATFSKLPRDAARSKGLSSFHLPRGFGRLPKMSKTRCQRNVEPWTIAILFNPPPGEFRRLLVVTRTQMGASVLIDKLI